MIRILILIALLASPQLYADPYETAQRFTAGDVISAEVLNDILDRIELSLKEITSDQLNGDWTATQYACVGQPCNLSSTAGSVIGATLSTSGNYFTREQVVTISGSTMSMPGYNFLALDDNGTLGINTTGISLDFEVLPSNAFVFTEGSNYRRSWSIEKKSDSRFIISSGIDGHKSYWSMTVLDKDNLPPAAPTLTNVNLSNGTAILNWTEGDSTQTGFAVHRKTSSTGTFASIATTTTASTYTDSSIAQDNTYWYRVFATNADGTSVGSNVLKVTFSNTPPAYDLKSLIEIYENTTAIVEVGATDAESDALTYSISSQSPGSDATYMSITSGGVLSFDSAPDYENPQDYGTNNTYQIKVTVSDGIDPVTQNVSVIIMNVSD